MIKLDFLFLKHASPQPLMAKLDLPVKIINKGRGKSVLI